MMFVGGITGGGTGWNAASATADGETGSVVSWWVMRMILTIIKHCPTIEIRFKISNIVGKTWSSIVVTIVAERFTG
jgi:hypothetical protein